jgi:tRNA nucleotidyltransferase (CCA-adding enzyme)
MFDDEPPGAEWDLGNEIAGVPRRRALAYLFWLAPLTAGRSHRIERRLKLRRSLIAVIADSRRLAEGLTDLAFLRPSEITFRLDELDPAAIYVVWRMTDDQSIADALLTYARSWRHIKPSTNGHTLAEHGLPPGPAYKHILTALRAAWLDDEISSDAEELETLQELLKSEIPS